MKKTIIFIAAIAALTISCNKEKTEDVDNSAANTKFQAWIRVNHPEAEKTGLGAYIISDKAGKGDGIGDIETNLFVLLEYTRKQLDGTITAYTSSDIAKQLDDYDSTHYYGPKVIGRATAQNMAALDESLCNMRVGGERSLAVPGWLTSYPVYSSGEQYYKKVSGTDILFDFKVVDAFNDLTEWESEKIEKYIKEQGLPLEKFEKDTAGFYYLTTKAPATDRSFEDDETFTVNYTGSRLDGQVFDSSILETYVDAGLDPSGRSFTASTITYNKDYKSIKFGSGSAVDGFSMALCKMRPGESITVILASSLAYGTTGGSDTGLIPPYCPLRFDIEMIDYSLEAEENK